MEMDEMGEDVTDGQMADYFASELSADMGNWDLGIVEYQCRRCGTTLEVISDSLKDLDVLITRWHEKTRVGDYFEKFVFEYLAFNAFLKSHVSLQARNDRGAIETLKRSEWKEAYLEFIGSAQEIKTRESWLAIITELKRDPFCNSSRDYDYPELDGKWARPVDGGTGGGIVCSIDDWENMVEFWYTVRNNLFHAGADPTLRRDVFLVEHAFITLNALMRLVVKSLAAPLGRR